MKRLLMVAFHFPPFAGSSGVQRTLRFVQQLPNYDWEPIVLTVHPRAYEAESSDLLRELPEGIVVERAFGLDAGRHLALFNRYPSALAQPDRWVTWRIGAVPVGIWLIRRYRPRAIWSTYPIATAHIIGADLQRLSGLPWIADFRDPMAQDGYPANPKTWRRFKSIEQTALRHAATSVFATPGAAALYRERYPDVPAKRVQVIENGYDEESFAAVGSLATTAVPLNPGKVTLLHSGVIYPSERDPTQLFAALGQLAQAGAISADRFCLRLRAPGHESLLRSLVTRYQIDHVVEIAPPIAYQHALEEMLRADGLLVLQASNCNQQIPAKLYEYLRTGRPILGLTDLAGDTGRALRDFGIDSIVRLDSVEDIARALPAFLDQIRCKSAPLPNATYVAGASRRRRTQQLASLLDSLTDRL